LASACPHACDHSPLAAARALQNGAGMITPALSRTRILLVLALLGVAACDDKKDASTPAKDDAPAANDPASLVAKAKPAALGFCRKPIDQLAAGDMPSFDTLVGLARSPRPFDRTKVAEAKFAFVGRAGFFTNQDGGIELVVTSKDADPCKADTGRKVTEKLDEPATTIEFREAPVPGAYVNTYTDAITEKTHKHIDATQGWPLVDKDKQPTDFDFVRGQVMLEVTKYEAGKSFEGKIIACGDPFVWASDPPEKAAAIESFLVGPITATACPQS
jgi:hypothetical protein